MLDDVLACAAIGSPDTVLRRLQELIARTGADELIVTSQIFGLGGWVVVRGGGQVSRRGEKVL